MGNEATMIIKLNRNPLPIYSLFKENYFFSYKKTALTHINRSRPSI